MTQIIGLKHFSIKDFRCPCCGKAQMDIHFLQKLEEARDLAERPWVIISGYRCKDYNVEVGGVQDSAHIYGKAVDIATPTPKKRLEVFKYAVRADFDRLGIAENYIHLDTDESRPPNAVWLNIQK